MNTQNEAAKATDGLATQDIRLGSRIITLMETESFAQSISRATWEVTQRKLTRLWRRFVNALKGATNELNM